MCGTNQTTKPTMATTKVTAPQVLGLLFVPIQRRMFSLSVSSALRSMWGMPSRMAKLSAKNASHHPQMRPHGRASADATTGVSCVTAFGSISVIGGSLISLTRTLTIELCRLHSGCHSSLLRSVFLDRWLV
jgi:hypothetical protein